MYDSGKIITGLVIFVLLVTIPVWYNRGRAASVPKLVLPKDAKTCKPGKATVTAIAAGKAHPYHLKAVSGGGSSGRP